MNKKQKRGWYLDDYKMGQKFVSPTRVVTETDIVNYGCLGGDFYPLHFDEDYAKGEGFRTRIFHGLGTLCLGGGFAYYALPLDCRIIGHLGGEYRLTAPVYPQDAIYAEFEVVEARPSKTKPDRGILGFKTIFKNQQDQVVCEWTFRFMYHRKPRKKTSVSRTRK